MISISELTKTYGTGDAAVTALSGVTLEIRDGEFVSIMGPSGSGKSTFLSLLGLLDRPTSGRYLIDGRDTVDLGDDDLASLRTQEVRLRLSGLQLYCRAAGSFAMSNCP